jgi:hypothetical protein
MLRRFKCQLKKKNQKVLQKVQQKAARRNSSAIQIKVLYENTGLFGFYGIFYKENN